MGKSPSKVGVIILPIVLAIILAACGDGKNDPSPLSPLNGVNTPTPTDMSTLTEEAEPVVITIGNFTDMTGPASNALINSTLALEDMVEYYNNNNLIPGVDLKVITYDSQYDPSRDIPGYEWLKERGAD